MPTQLEAAKRGATTEEMLTIAKEEGVSLDSLRQRVAQGSVVIPCNLNRRGEVKRLGIGEGLRTKVNVNVGTSPDLCDLSLEVEKAKTALRFGADSIMDLSIAGLLDNIRKKLMEVVDRPFGTVPVYQAAVEAASKEGSLIYMTEDDLFNAIERHARDGADFMTVHCGITKDLVEQLRKQPRLMGIVSRGGCFLANWILHNERENPLFEHFDCLLEIAREHDVTLSLGDALRPGSIFDASDYAQVSELLTVGRLVKRARDAGIQVMVEGPGHVPLDQIEAQVKLAKAVTGNAPLYLLGPLPTDIAPGYDHITAAIGGAIAAAAGTDFLCVVTPSEHLGLPLVEDVKLGTLAAKIAAHTADVAKLGNKASKWDFELDQARSELDWESQFKKAIDPEAARKIYERVKPKSGTCTMCGEWCALKLSRRSS